MCVKERREIDLGSTDESRTATESYVIVGPVGRIVSETSGLPAFPEGDIGVTGDFFKLNTYSSPVLVLLTSGILLGVLGFNFLVPLPLHESVTSIVDFPFPSTPYEAKHLSHPQLSYRCYHKYNAHYFGTR